MKRFSFLKDILFRRDPYFICQESNAHWPSKKDLTRLLWLFLAIAALGCTIHIPSGSRSEAILYVNGWLCFVALVFIAGLCLVNLAIGSLSWIRHWFSRRRIR